MATEEMILFPAMRAGGGRFSVRRPSLIAGRVKIVASSRLEAVSIMISSERTVDAVWQRPGSLLDGFLPQECANYLRNAGYASV